MLLSEILKSILLEGGNPISFIKFYNELSKGYNPDNAILFDCLMTLKEYYESYMKWYEKYPKQKTTDVEVYGHFQNRLKEILIAIDSDDIRKKIIAVDNGINQWHIDLPVVHHLYLGIEDGGDDWSDKELQWLEVMQLLKKLGKLPDKSPYKRLYESLEMITDRLNYWLDNNGEAKKVSNHESYARHLSRIIDYDISHDKAYDWMYKRGWARITIERNEIYIDTCLSGGIVNLTTKQKDWIREMQLIYKTAELQAVNKFGRRVEL